jgi:phospholipid N-methyltransferase
MIARAKAPEHPTLSFLLEILRAPAEVGAIAPSSRRVAELAIEKAGIREAKSIVELGAGSGAVTAEILRNKPAHARVLAVERSRPLASKLAERFPEAEVVCGCATRLGEQMRLLNFEPADSILSTLPWTVFPPETQQAVLTEIRDALSPDGTFATIVCQCWRFFEAGRRFRGLLGHTFGSVHATDVVFANLPPAFVYYCKR